MHFSFVFNCVIDVDATKPTSWRLLINDLSIYLSIYLSILIHLGVFDNTFRLTYIPYLEYMFGMSWTPDLPSATPARQGGVSYHKSKQKVVKAQTGAA